MFERSLKHETIRLTFFFAILEIKHAKEEALYHLTSLCLKKCYLICVRAGLQSEVLLVSSFNFSSYVLL